MCVPKFLEIQHTSTNTYPTNQISNALIKVICYVTFAESFILHTELYQF